MGADAETCVYVQILHREIKTRNCFKVGNFRISSKWKDKGHSFFLEQLNYKRHSANDKQSQEELVNEKTHVIISSSLGTPIEVASLEYRLGTHVSEVNIIIPTS